jgi:LmbE family N-acetylglucosaminyl deacetylase
VSLVISLRSVTTVALSAVISIAVGPAVAPAQSARPLLAAFAHPDDERVVGPLLSRLGREGREIHLVIATDGSKGTRDHAGIPAGQQLAAARATEAECAAKRLGVRQLHMLGLEDGGLASFASLGRLRTELSSIIARVQPAAIITFGPEGGTGHPDHRLVGNVVSEIVQSDDRYRMIDLYYASLPTERLVRAPASSPRVNGVAEQLLTVRVPFDEQDLVAGREAFACHRTQYTPAEMDAINKTLAYVWNGSAYLRPWNGVVRDSARAVRP